MTQYTCAVVEYLIWQQDISADKSEYVEFHLCSMSYVKLLRM